MKRTALVWLLLLWGCRLPIGHPSEGIPNVGSLLAPPFTGQDKVLQGLDPLQLDSTLSLGDRVLFGVRLEDPDEGLREWMILLTVRSSVLPNGSRIALGKDEAGYSGPNFLVSESMNLEFSVPSTKENGKIEKILFSSDSVLLAVDIFEGGVFRKREFAFAPEAFLREGFFASSTFFLENFEKFERKDNEAILNIGLIRWMRPIMSLTAFFRIAQKLEGLAPLLDGMIARPSILSVIANLGVDVSTRPYFEKVYLEERRFAPWGELPIVYRFPVEIRVNEGLVSRFHLIVGPVTSPLGLAAGILAIEGARPDDAQKRFGIRLLAAKRGGSLIGP